MSVPATTFECRGCGAEATFPDDVVVDGVLRTAARQAINAMWCIGRYGHLCPKCWEPFHTPPSDPRAEAVPGKIVDTGPYGIYFGHQQRVFVATCGGCRRQVEFSADDYHAAERAQMAGWEEHRDVGWCCNACHVFVSSVRAEGGKA